MVPFFKGDRYPQKYELIGNGGNIGLNTIRNFLIDGDWQNITPQVKKTRYSFGQMVFLPGKSALFFSLVRSKNIECIEKIRGFQ